VGSASPAADAELLMMVADTLEALGLKRGEYVVKVSSRKLIDGVLEAGNVDQSKRGSVMRAIDKLDRLGVDGVKSLLGSGRKDESGDFAEGAKLSPQQIELILTAIRPDAISGQVSLSTIEQLLTSHQTTSGAQGVRELQSIVSLVGASNYGLECIRLDPTIVRGLDYYTGPVFEAQLTFPVINEAGETVVFGSVAGGGRYDDLVARFTGQQVPATGISIGVSRLLAALQSRGLTGDEQPLIVVLSMGDAAQSFATARELRKAGLRAESYVGTKKIPDQLKYADKRGAALVVMEGDDERAKGEVTIKDLKLGA
jgi:histidyl-tRNA synthetase